MIRSIAAVRRGRQQGRDLRLACWLVTFEVAGGTLLAFRRPTSVGNVSLSRLGLVLAACLLATRGRIRIPIPLHRLVIASMFLLTALALGELYSVNLAEGRVVIGDAVEAIGVLIATALLVTNLHAGEQRSSGRLLVAAVRGFLPTTFLALFQAAELYRGRRPTIPFISLSTLDSATANSARTAFDHGLNEYHLDRVAAATGDPPTLGIICAVALLYTLWVRRTGNLERGVLYYAVILSAAAGVILSESASALIVLAAGLLVQAPWSSARWVRLSPRLLVVLVCAVALDQVPGISAFVASAQSRIGLAVSAQGSSVSHLGLVHDAWGMFAAHPITGVGTGSFSTLEAGVVVAFSSAHDAYLLMLAEGGLIGFAALAWFLWTVKRYAHWELTAPIFVALAVYLDFDRVPALWVVLGLSLGYRQVSKSISGPPTHTGGPLPAGQPAPGPIVG